MYIKQVYFDFFFSPITFVAVLDKWNDLAC